MLGFFLSHTLASEIMCMLIRLHSVHGNNWKRIATLVGRDSEACKDKWRYVKWSKSKDYKIGNFSLIQHSVCEKVQLNPIFTVILMQLLSRLYGDLAGGSAKGICLTCFLAWQLLVEKRG